MSRAKKEEGILGEEYAVSYLKTRGYTILERNFRTRNGEIDIIAIDCTEKPSVLSFVEVKTRTSDEFGAPLEAIGYYKLSALRRTAQLYTFSHKDLPESMRLDAVSVILNEQHKPISIELVKNIG